MERTYPHPRFRCSEELREYAADTKNSYSEDIEKAKQTDAYQKRAKLLGSLLGEPDLSQKDEYAKVLCDHVEFFKLVHDLMIAQPGNGEAFRERELTFATEIEDQGEMIILNALRVNGFVEKEPTQETRRLEIMLQAFINREGECASIMTRAWFGRKDQPVDFVYHEHEGFRIDKSVYELGSFRSHRVEDENEQKILLQRLCENLDHGIQEYDRSQNNEVCALLSKMQQQE